jgi:hypothetical protein
MIYACRLLKVPFTQYLGQALLPPLLVATGPILLLGLLTTWHTPDSWPVLIGFGLLYSIAFGLVTGVFLIGLGRLRTGLVNLLQRSPRASADVPPVEGPVVQSATSAVVE